MAQRVEHCRFASRPAFLVLQFARMDLRNAKYILPNLFTLASVLFGMVAMTLTMMGGESDFTGAAICILLAMVADSFDGRVARMTGTATRFGIQLDSLADAISFGAAPALLAWAFSLKSIGDGRGFPGLLIAFVYVACGIMRLARFNVTSSGKGRKANYFQGLPIPAGAAVVVTIIWSMQDLNVNGADKIGLMSFVMLATSFLMISNVPYRNFKHVRIGLWLRVLIVLAAATLIFLAIRFKTSYVLAILVMTYLLMGPVEGTWMLVRRAGRGRGGEPDAGSGESESEHR